MKEQSTLIKNETHFSGLNAFCSVFSSILLCRQSPANAGSVLNVARRLLYLKDVDGGPQSLKITGKSLFFILYAVIQNVALLIFWEYQKRACYSTVVPQAKTRKPGEKKHLWYTKKNGNCKPPTDSVRCQPRMKAQNKKNWSWKLQFHTNANADTTNKKKVDR